MKIKSMNWLTACAAVLSLVASPALAQQVVGASVRSTAPTYISGESRPLSMDLSANLRVTDGDEVAAANADSVPVATTAGANRSFSYALGSTAWDRLRTVSGMVAPANASGVLAVATVPVSSSNTSIVGSARTSAGVALVLKASAGNFYDATVVATTAGYVMVHNATAAPADGVVTPRHCVPAAAGETVTISMGQFPEWMSTGVVVVFSSTGCFTQTLASAAFIRGRAL